MMGDDITLGPLCCPSITSCLTKVGLPLSSQTAQRLGGSQVVQSLTTPVVSVATPSLLAPFSGMQTAYNTGKTPRVPRCLKRRVEGLEKLSELHEYSLCSLCEMIPLQRSALIWISCD